MTINYVPFESQSGFKSPGFRVSETGNLTVEGTVNLNGPINTSQNFTINGVVVIDDTDSVVSLGSSIKNSSLTRLGVLEILQIDGDFTVAQGSSPYFSVVNGHVEIESFAGTGRIDNIDIGLQNPGDANFKSVNIGPGDSTGELSVQGDIIVTQDLTVGNSVSVTGNVLISSIPTLDNHATRKDYVDSRATAFAVAFGA
jgi:cytoskeletal protein CcmA (bactofilin family)